MRMELEQHLVDAQVDGRDPEAVVGPNLASFAEAWAAEFRRPDRAPDFARITADRTGTTADRRVLWTYAAGAAALVAGVAAGNLLAGGGEDVENELWRWVWVIFSIGMGIGEIFTAGFFLLPFAIGAAAAAVLAWLGVNLLAQWLVFFGVSLVALAYLRRFIARQDALAQPRVGANRWLEARGIVLEEIDPVSGKGMVRVENEEWRATTDAGPIPAGSRIVVRDVRGARLVVELDETP
jgi:membrane protein implicated in regulation of membrane protease activity